MDLTRAFPGNIIAAAAAALCILAAGGRGEEAPVRLDAATSDTAAASSAPGPRPDTAFVPPAGGVWTMDELKSILGAETAGFVGKEYRQRRNGRVAMLCALAFPGLGQMYNEKPLKAAIAMGAETFYTMMIYQNQRLWSREKSIRDRFPVNSSDWRFHDAWVAEYRERSVEWIWWSAATLLVIVIDAYVDAHLDDMRFEMSPRASSDGVGLQFVLRY
jgi:hypothetical protein